jgi:dethiobiotin synthetase
VNKGNGIFITGTDTGVGKTLVAATIARLLCLNGLKVGVMKPVTSGCSEVDGRLVSDDAELLCWAANCTADRHDVAPYLLREPLAPSEAAKLDGVNIDLSLLASAYERLSNDHDIVIVEGAGGLMVPLVGGFLIADLILQLHIPALVVARPNLGTVNHTVLTCFAARQLGIKVSGVLINNYPSKPGKAEASAPHLISSLSGAHVLGILPHIPEDDQKIVVAELAARLAAEPATEILLREIAG